MKKTRGHTSAVQVAIACIIMSEHSPKACETNNGGLILDAGEPDDIPWRDMTLIRLLYRYFVVQCAISASPTSLSVATNANNLEVEALSTQSCKLKVRPGGSQ